jgi:hypothetical protein
MSAAVKISFGPLAAPKGSAFVVFVGADMKPAAAVTVEVGDLEPLIRAAAKAANFKGAQRTALDILAPSGPMRRGSSLSASRRAKTTRRWIS